MQITVSSVSVSKVKNTNGRGFYEVLEVDYGSKYPKKIMSFSNAAVFATLKDAKEGDTFEVTETQNGQYTNWSSATKVEGGTVSDRPSAANPKAVPKVTSTYETAEERATRQRLIVRQSSLAQAISFHHNTGQNGATEEDILAQAERFTAWVFAPPDLFNEPNDDLN